MLTEFGKEPFKTITVDGFEYVLYLWNPDKASKWIRRCQEIFIKPIASSIGNNLSIFSGNNESNFQNVKIDIEKGFNSFLNSLDETTYVNYLKDIFDHGVSYKSNSINFNKHFKGELLHMHKLAYAILEYQLSDFFDAVRGGVSKYLSQNQKKGSETSTTEKLNGEFGE
ncbi:MAG: hypothetical protein DCC88_00320 [Spirobacillus cienkowskii]|jgi:hypothetical protein|uniref:Uncharacterized protein n=1 Tax=Spirobacillus cienkowskii TaxID=495820 RepID=A0A369KXG4_9BACT|nr:MAG: hypothetical protein DCC88_00320 [Spirobacillus cienkowskii]